MDIEKILEASRSENKKGDEMKKLNDMKAAKVGLIAMSAVNIFILLYSYFITGENLITILCPIFAGIAALFISEYQLNRKFWMLVSASIASVIFIVLFLLVIGQFSYMVVHIYG
jgi:hypothetical protein